MLRIMFLGTELVTYVSKIQVDPSSSLRGIRENTFYFF